MPHLRPLLLAIFAAVLGLAARPAHAEDRIALLRTCAMNASHVQQRQCLESKLSESLAVLTEAQRGMLKKLQLIDQDKDEKERALAAAQADAQAFVEYSGKHCDSFAALSFGGNSQQDRRLACKIELNAIRAQQLFTVASSLP